MNMWWKVDNTLNKNLTKILKNRFEVHTVSLEKLSSKLQISKLLYYTNDKQTEKTFFFYYFQINNCKLLAVDSFDVLIIYTVIYSFTLRYFEIDIISPPIFLFRKFQNTFNLFLLLVFHFFFISQKLFKRDVLYDSPKICIFSSNFYF